MKLTLTLLLSTLFGASTLALPNPAITSVNPTSILTSTISRSSSSISPASSTSIVPATTSSLTATRISSTPTTIISSTPTPSTTSGTLPCGCWNDCTLNATIVYPGDSGKLAACPSTCDSQYSCSAASTGVMTTMTAVNGTAQPCWKLVLRFEKYGGIAFKVWVEWVKYNC